MASRRRYGFWIEAQIVSVPASRSGHAMAPRGSMGTAASRGWWKRPPTVTSARAKAASASPTVAPTGSVLLSVQPSCTRAGEASDASVVASGGSGSYSTSTASSASASR